MEDTMQDTEICYMSAVDMAQAIRTRKLSPVEVVNAVLSRIERLNPKINAYCTLLVESAKKQAREAEAKVMKEGELGPLHGIPVSIKDLTYTKGVRTTSGSKIYENFVPNYDAIVVERLKAAGAIMLGKTNTPEFGFTGTTDNLLFGLTRNPWNLERHAGGSSGGAAAAVAAGMGQLAKAVMVVGQYVFPVASVAFSESNHHLAVFHVAQAIPVGKHFLTAVQLPEPSRMRH